MIESNQEEENRFKLNQIEVVAQCFLFFVAGFETTASTLTYAFYELAKNQDVQDRLANEIEAALADHDQNDHDAVFETIVNDIPYLEACIKETLRKYPPVIRLERTLNKQGYKLGGIELDKGTVIEIPTLAVHYNPEYYPNPEQYNPDRFMPENKDALVPYTYIPFGAGPRNCVGTRFAYQEIKLCLARVVPKYKVSLAKGMPTKIQFKPNPALLIPLQTDVLIERR